MTDLNNINKKIKEQFFRNKQYQNDLSSYIKQSNWIWKEIKEINFQIENISSKLKKEEMKGE